MTTPMTSVDVAEVTQADREAAAKLYEWFPALSSSPDAGEKAAQFIRDGGADGWSSVQLFAANRTTFTDALIVAHEAALEALRPFALAADDYDAETFRDDQKVVGEYVEFTFGDLRRARTLLGDRA